MDERGIFWCNVWYFRHIENSSIYSTWRSYSPVHTLFLILLCYKDTNWCNRGALFLLITAPIVYMYVSISFLNMCTLVSTTQLLGKEFHESTTLCAKKYFLMLRWQRVLIWKLHRVAPGATLTSENSLYLCLPFLFLLGSWKPRSYHIAIILSPTWLDQAQTFVVRMVDDEYVELTWLLCVVYFLKFHCIIRHIYRARRHNVPSLRLWHVCTRYLTALRGDISG
jgi:hypothetical protein